MVDNDSSKIFEVEREELILRLEVTEAVENLVKEYDKTSDEKCLIDLGKLVTDEILNNTKDFTGKYVKE